MAQQTINTGTNPNDGTGDTILAAMEKVNANFTDLYTTSYANNIVRTFNTRTGAVVLTSADVTSALTYTPVNKAGDSMSGTLLMNSGFIAAGNGSSGCLISQNTGTSTALPAYTTGSVLRNVNTDGISAVVSAESYNNAGNPSSTFLVRGARGTGIAPSAIANNDVIGQIGAAGFGSTVFQNTPTATVSFVSEGAFTDTSQPTAITFQVTPLNSVAKAEQMRLSSAGVLTIDSTAPSTTTTSGALIVSGGVGIAGNLNVGGSIAFANLNGTPIGQTTPAAGSFTTLNATSGINSTSIGLTTAAAGAFTSLSATGTLTGITGRLINVQVITSTGTYTPTTGTNSVLVYLVGSGGAGGGAAATTTTGQVAIGGGGGAGGLCISRLTSAFSGVTITIGAGGAGASGTTGGAGGTTSFGALLTITGGVGGGVAGPSTTCAGIGGTGGVASGGTISNARGMPGVSGFGVGVTAGMGSPGSGGSTMFGGGGGVITLSGTAAGVAGTGYGSGGSGAGNIATVQSAATGGAGMPGLCVIYEYA